MLEELPPGATCSSGYRGRPAAGCGGRAGPSWTPCATRAIWRPRPCSPSKDRGETRVRPGEGAFAVAPGPPAPGHHWSRNRERQDSHRTRDPHIRRGARSWGLCKEEAAAYQAKDRCCCAELARGILCKAAHLKRAASERGEMPLERSSGTGSSSPASAKSPDARLLLPMSARRRPQADLQLCRNVTEGAVAWSSGRLGESIQLLGAAELGIRA